MVGGETTACSMELEPKGPGSSLGSAAAATGKIAGGANVATPRVGSIPCSQPSCSGVNSSERVAISFTEQNFGYFLASVGLD